VFGRAVLQLLERHQPALERLHDGLSPVFHLQFRQHARHVRLDGFVADVERRRDLAVGSAERDVAQHVELAWRKLVAVVHCTVLQPSRHEALADTGIDEGSPRRHGAHRRQQDFRLCVLADVADGAGAQHAHHARLVHRGSQRHHLHRTAGGQHTARGFDPVDAARNQKILQDHVGRPLVETQWCSHGG